MRALVTRPLEWLSDAPVQVSASQHVNEEFLAWEPGRAFGFSVTHMARPVFRTLNELVTIEAAEAGVRVTYQQAFEPRPWAPFMRLAAKRGMPKGLERGLEGLEKQISKGE